MKHIYTRCFFILVILSSLHNSLNAQCEEGITPGATAYDTTIKIASGVYSAGVKFPKFNSATGMITCVNLCITITGIIDSVFVENNAVTPSTFRIRYRREDEVSGPGFTSPTLSNSTNYSSPNINLTGTDGIYKSGTDYYASQNDTILNRQVCRVISDAGTLGLFYGPAGDSVDYLYTIDVESYVQGAGDFISGIATSAYVNFHFEYCTCPSVILPLNLKEFDVNKLTNNKAELTWSGFDDPTANYRYEAEVSKDGRHFSSMGSVAKNLTGANPYKMVYTAGNGEKGVYYFRIKQVYANGYVRYSNTKQVRLESSASFKFSVYPNPSTGIVGIKFDNSMSGKFDVIIYNSQGQKMVSKELEVNGSSYAEVTTLNSGVYWLRMTDKSTQVSCVNQLLIK